MMIARPVEIHAGYRRRLTRLTGLEVQENQARQLLVDIEAARRSGTRTWTSRLRRNPLEWWRCSTRGPLGAP